MEIKKLKIKNFLLYITLSVILSYISIFFIGFSFGEGNNVFHIPLVLDLSKTNEFLDDAFYGSLKNFTSIIWIFIKPFSNESNIEYIFYAAHFVSRAAAFLCMIFIFRKLGVASNIGITICMVSATITPWLQGSSVVGGHEMFIDYFTHSETTWPLVFLFVLFLSDNKLISSAAVAGATFSINAFIGIWLLLSGVILWIIRRMALDMATSIKAIASFLLFALPTVIWIAITVSGTNGETNFDYKEYIRLYYPLHFLIEASPAWDLILFAITFFSGLIAAKYLYNEKFWINIQISFVIIFLIGIPMPYIINDRFIFNLHLLRSAGLEQAMAIILILACGSKMILISKDRYTQLLGLVVIFSLVALDRSISAMSLTTISLLLGALINHEPPSKYFIKITGIVEEPQKYLVIPVVILFFYVLLNKIFIKPDIGISQAVKSLIIATPFMAVFLSGKISFDARQFSGVFLLLYFALYISKSYFFDNQYFNNEKPNGDWDNFTKFIKDSDIHGIFLLSVGDKNSDQFQLQAKRKVWVDWKQGAAVMWSPSFYNQWMPRYKEVKNLNTPNEFINYAKAHNIHNVVIKSKDGSCPSSSYLVKSTTSYVLCRTQISD